MKRFKAANPDDEDEFYDYNTAQETLKFNSMAPQDGEILVAFHGRLAKQAALCGFQCDDCRGSSIKQRLIRDRLLHALNDDVRELVFKDFKNPSVDDILKVYQVEHDFQNHPGWIQILSYLELAELHTFAESHPRFQKIVLSYLDKGGKLIIGGRSLIRYQEIPEIYSDYGDYTTVIELADAYGSEILREFPELSELTVKVPRFTANMEDLPGSLKKIQLIFECEWWWGELGKFLEKSNNSLEHLYISNRGTCRKDHYHSYSYNDYKLTVAFPKLKSMTLINVPMEILVDDQQFCPNLEKLMIAENSFDNSQVDWTPYHGLPITSLTLDRWDWDQDIKRYAMVHSLPNLRHLRILQATRSEFKEQIMALDLESVDVYFLDAPKQDLLIDMLDDDCLHVIMDSLAVEDLASLCQVHSRFSKVIAAQPKIELICDEKFLRRYPVMDNRAFYYWLGRIVSNLNVCSCKEDDLCEIIGYFFGRLQCFDMNDSDMSRSSKSPSKSKMSQIFRELNPPLVELRLVIYTEAVAQSLPELTNVRGARLSIGVVIPELFAFLTQNQGHMERLDIDVMDIAEDDILQFENHLSLGKMKSLKCLTLWNNELYFVISRVHFPELVELQLHGNSSELSDVFWGAELPKLTSLKLEITCQSLIEFGQVLKNAVPQIEELAIVRIYESVHSEHLTEEILLGPSGLRTLDISFPKNRDSRISDDYILSLVKGLPKLETLRTKLAYDVLALDTMRELRSYLQENNRKLRLNNMFLY